MSGKAYAKAAGILYVAFVSAVICAGGSVMAQVSNRECWKAMESAEGCLKAGADPNYLVDGDRPLGWAFVLWTNRCSRIAAQERG